ncbi:50S ribosomal protein L6 [Neoehrlichia mikurensis]|uniref:50S ribosomal protein L6 n=1 Tax=Neoehrlichia mikurensis TaxID=89586 RepID=A0A9Q9F3N5_9RICK|nr:50S ribosomal protein L6 [Neoehrlichia mikurensis]QXK91805.1 50S ribosomal protein L6 [Neoehrlichia mikurensis]QXK93018.1 50S ribosomal protein L6 [Neoehrlichia mikurensis]QXK93496.1 50S ribosomal protein L6 [Neoehrlichia mikurensis]UTO55550.1 50S ribosomal protein L6 [Neoehrlichia mikurensis]UTO56471.1 50S ribosomal protein L6 [Neoehrlichia mikurensis]
MSRIGSMPIVIPQNVSVEVSGNNVTISNSKGSSNFILNYGITCNIQDNKLFLINNDKFAKAKAMWGTYRSCINNLIQGYGQEFCIELEVKGVGYKIENYDTKSLLISLGYSHSIIYLIPNDIDVKCIKSTQVLIKGINKEKVSMLASEICSLRKYNVYKGKGVFIKGKVMLKKEINKKK